MFFYFMLCAGLFNIVYVLIRLEELSTQLFRFSTSGFFAIVTVVGMAVIFCRVYLTTAVIVGCAYPMYAVILFWDLNGRSLAFPQWPMLVLMIDFMLVMQVPQRYTIALVCFTVLWLLFVSLEETFRFGLLDLSVLRPQEGTYGRREYYRQRTDCEVLPCAVPFPPSGFIPALAVFLIDFLATRGFARQVLEEQASMERTINVVQEIASLLAGYDVEKVAELLEKHGGDLPHGMTVALRTLEDNLRMYKAYLPKTCLPFAEDDADAELLAFDVTSESYDTGSVVSLKARSTAPLCLSLAHITLLVVNVKDTFHLLEDCPRFSDLFTTLLQRTLQATESRRGMVDVFIGDRIHCSFNASKRCANHATSALHAATALLHTSSAPHINMGVATGDAMRGDMGCEVMRRFSMVGTLVRDVGALERAGRTLGCDVLCNRICFSDAECEHQLRLIPRKVDVTDDASEIVAELVIPEESSPRALGGNYEWMYTIGEKHLWEDYNTTVRRYLRGEATADDVEAAGNSTVSQHTVCTSLRMVTPRSPSTFVEEIDKTQSSGARINNTPSSGKDVDNGEE